MSLDVAAKACPDGRTLVAVRNDSKCLLRRCARTRMHAAGAPGSRLPASPGTAMIITQESHEPERRYSSLFPFDQIYRHRARKAKDRRVKRLNIKKPVLAVGLRSRHSRPYESRHTKPDSSDAVSASLPGDMRKRTPNAPRHYRLARPHRDTTRTGADILTDLDVDRTHATITDDPGCRVVMVSLAIEAWKAGEPLLTLLHVWKWSSRSSPKRLAAAVLPTGVGRCILVSEIWPILHGQDVILRTVPDAVAVF
ncbi:hypothetical protein VTO73DRAFT_11394 [Trametes versicolor]